MSDDCQGIYMYFEEPICSCLYENIPVHPRFFRVLKLIHVSEDQIVNVDNERVRGAHLSGFFVNRDTYTVCNEHANYCCDLSKVKSLDGLVCGADVWSTRAGYSAGCPPYSLGLKEETALPEIRLPLMPKLCCIPFCTERWTEVYEGRKYEPIPDDWGGNYRIKSVKPTTVFAIFNIYKCQ